MGLGGGGKGEHECEVVPPGSATSQAVFLTYGMRQSVSPSPAATTLLPIYSREFLKKFVNPEAGRSRAGRGGWSLAEEMTDGHSQTRASRRNAISLSWSEVSEGIHHLKLNLTADA